MTFINRMIPVYSPSIEIKDNLHNLQIDLLAIFNEIKNKKLNEQINQKLIKENKKKEILEKFYGNNKNNNNVNYIDNNKLHEIQKRNNICFNNTDDSSSAHKQNSNNPKKSPPTEIKLIDSCKNNKSNEANKLYLDQDNTNKILIMKFNMSNKLSDNNNELSEFILNNNKSKYKSSNENNPHNINNFNNLNIFNGKIFNSAGNKRSITISANKKSPSSFHREKCYEDLDIDIGSVTRNLNKNNFNLGNIVNNISNNNKHLNNFNLAHVHNNFINDYKMHLQNNKNESKTKVIKDKEKSNSNAGLNHDNYSSDNNLNCISNTTNNIIDTNNINISLNNSFELTHNMNNLKLEIESKVNSPIRQVSNRDFDDTMNVITDTSLRNYNFTYNNLNNLSNLNSNNMSNINITNLNNTAINNNTNTNNNTIPINNLNLNYAKMNNINSNSNFNSNINLNPQNNINGNNNSSLSNANNTAILKNIREKYKKNHKRSYSSVFKSEDLKVSKLDNINNNGINTNNSNSNNFTNNDFYNINLNSTSNNTNNIKINNKNLNHNNINPIPNHNTNYQNFNQSNYNAIYSNQLNTNSLSEFININNITSPLSVNSYMKNQLFINKNETTFISNTNDKKEIDNKTLLNYDSSKNDVLFNGFIGTLTPSRQNSFNLNFFVSRNESEGLINLNLLNNNNNNINHNLHHLNSNINENSNKTNNYNSNNSNTNSNCGNNDKNNQRFLSYISKLNIDKNSEVTYLEDQKNYNNKIICYSTNNLTTVNEIELQFFHQYINYYFIFFLMFIIMIKIVFLILEKDIKKI